MLRTCPSIFESRLTRFRPKFGSHADLLLTVGRVHDNNGNNNERASLSSLIVFGYRVRVRRLRAGPGDFLVDINRPSYIIIIKYVSPAGSRPACPTYKLLLFIINTSWRARPTGVYGRANERRRKRVVPGPSCARVRRFPTSASGRREYFRAPKQTSVEIRCRRNDAAGNGRCSGVSPFSRVRSTISLFSTVSVRNPPRFRQRRTVKTVDTSRFRAVAVARRPGIRTRNYGGKIKRPHGVACPHVLTCLGP